MAKRTQQDLIDIALSSGFVPRGERTPKRDIPCRRCAQRTDLDTASGRWKHEDGTDACVDPETMNPYEETK